METVSSQRCRVMVESIEEQGVGRIGLVWDRRTVGRTLQGYVAVALE